MDTDVSVIVHDFKIRGKPIYLKSVPMRKFKHWSAVVVTLVVTVFGALLYINFSSGEKQIHYEIEHEFAVEDPQLLRSIAPLLGPEILPGKRVTALHNGRDIFPAMLAAIRCPLQRAQAEVKMHVILDAVGCGKIETTYLDEMKAAGVQVERYHPLNWYTLARINNRTHRKLLVDGRIGFTGGVGITDPWTGNADAADHWRDSHYQLEGPAVAQMQAVFCDNWIKTRAKVLCGPAYFPNLKPVGDSSAQVFKSSRGEGSESVRLMYLLSIASATKSIRLQVAYFVPDELAIRTFISAYKRGVKVEIIVLGPHADSEIVAGASRALWGDLLDAGVQIHEFQPAMYHYKVIIVDGVWVSVGSTNFDDRSFRLNDEANLNVYDRAFAAEQVGQDKAKSRRMSRAEFKNRSFVGKIWNHVSVSLRRQL